MRVSRIKAKQSCHRHVQFARMRWNPMKKNAVALAWLLLAAPCFGQIKVSTITDETTESSKSVMTALRTKLASHPKAFTLTSNDDAGPALLITADCMARTGKESFAC